MSDDTHYFPMTATRTHQFLAWRQIVAKAWKDSDFKADLLADPNATLAAHGFPMEEGVDYRVIEDGSGQQSLVLPAAPAGVDPNDAGGSDIDPGF